MACGSPQLSRQALPCHCPTGERGDGDSQLAIRERTVSMLRNVSDELARAVAEGLGMRLPRPMPRVMDPPRLEVTSSPAYPSPIGPGTALRGRKVAILTAPGVDADSVTRTQAALAEAGAVVRLLAARLGSLDTANGETVEADATFETMPSVLFDAVVVPDGERAAAELAALGHAREFLRDQFRHGKAILMLGAGERVVAEAGVPVNDGSDWALVRDIDAFSRSDARRVGKALQWHSGALSWRPTPSASGVPSPCPAKNANIRHTERRTVPLGSSPARILWRITWSNASSSLMPELRVTVRHAVSEAGTYRLPSYVGSTTDIVLADT